MRGKTAILLALACALILAALAVGNGPVAEAEDGLRAFYRKTLPAFLSGAETENHVFSPVSAYLVLSLLAETSTGGTQAQLLNLLGEDSLEGVRAAAAALLDEEFETDYGVCHLAGSLWLNEDVDFNAELLDALAWRYFAPSFQGKMASAEFSAAFRQWLNGETGGLMEAQTEGLEFAPETLMAAAGTLYFRGRWYEEFRESGERRIFHAPGGDIEPPFMEQWLEDGLYMGDGFTAVYKPFQDRGGMLFVLPVEGVAPADLLERPKALDFLAAGSAPHAQKRARIHLLVPRFDAVSALDLLGGLRALGVTEAFDPAAADFSPLTDAPAYVSRVAHAARVTVDEEGIEAAAYTVAMADSAAAMPGELEEVEFVLDRPFLFSIIGGGEAPLFAGVINKP